MNTSTNTGSYPPLTAIVQITDTSSVAIIAGVSLLLVSFLALRGTSDGYIVDLGGLPIRIAWTFFSRRFDFMAMNFKKTGGLPFKFRVLQHRVVAVGGPEARKVFFNDPSLGFAEGYEILMGGAPRLEDINIDVKSEGMGNVSDFVKRLNLLLKKERITETLPVFLDDTNRRMVDWGKEGTINPFKQVYDLVFQMTIRMATCRELAENPAEIRKLADLYWDTERSATPTRLLLPWLPSPSKKLNKQATTGLYLLFLKYVETRRAAGADTMDPIDILVRNGDSDNTIVALILGVTFAGVVNTGMNSCWALLFLGTHPEWRRRTVEELKALTAKYSNLEQSPAGEPFHRMLSKVPLEAWEDELPTLDLVIRETIRLTINGSALRRNLRKDVNFQGATVNKGDFVCYSVADTHLNPGIYPDPEQFDPGRYEKGREEDKSAPLAYLGWGVGRHPCAGMKVAKLEIKLILSMLLLGYEYNLVDGQGQSTNIIPKPDRNDIQQARPLGDPVYLKFKRVQD
ncbi:cytochrome P450 [Crepidotus variabilis]|uniref:Cytochrome P450 n=1 Tax=Crepidotus variabilis TaxID=179855 RepID=A0A9P6EIB5_9AGAR|nr:cytochrome P450 [Crepidotus variabilis]